VYDTKNKVMINSIDGKDIDDWSLHDVLGVTKIPIVKDWSLNSCHSLWKDRAHCTVN